MFHSEDFNEDVAWDAVWEAHARIDSLGWTAEFRIPLSQLRYSTRGPRDSTGAAGGQTWGIEFLRDVARRNERDYWQPIEPNVPAFVSRFGDLTGLRDLASPRRMEVLPYTVGRLTRSLGNTADPFFDRSDWYGSGGADVRFGLTSNLTVNATINPDFGQVEADPSVVNLTAFETFFPERRPFFVEGSNIFRFDVSYPYFIRGTGFRSDQPLYSRRIGRAPQAGLPGDAVFGESPQAANILAAVKLSGKTASGWSIGALDAVTGRKSADYVDTAGLRRRATVEPLANYTVARVSHDYRHGQSAVGGIFTATSRALNDDRLDSLRGSAYTAGLDVRHRFSGGNRELAASLLGTTIRGTTQAISRVQLGRGHYFQRPDAPHLSYDSTRTSLSGFATSLRLEKIAGGRWRYGLYGHARSPGLEMNDLGFQRNTDWILEGAWLGYQQSRPHGWYRQWNFNLNHWAGWSFGGERLALGGNVNGFLQLKNFWGMFCGFDHELPAYSASELRGGPLLYKTTWTSGGCGLFGDQRHRVTWQLNGGFSAEYQSGSHSYNVGPDLTIRPNARMDVSLSPFVFWNKDRTQFVAIRNAANGPHYVFGRIDQTEAAFTVRLNYTFTPDLSLQVYAQPFISAGRYDQFKEVLLRARAASTTGSTPSRRLS